MPLNDYMFDWKDPNITDWKKTLRIVFSHGFNDIDCRGIGSYEIARLLILKHEKDLKEDEKEYLKGLIE